MAKYIFVKVSDKQVVSSNNVDEALQTALAQGIVKIEEINDYVVLKEDYEGQYQAGTIELDINWH